MKKLLILIFSIIFFSASRIEARDIIPSQASFNFSRTVGVYQVGNDITIYQEPDENSLILHRVRWDKSEFFPEAIGANKFFALLIDRKDFALVNVTDVTEDWVEIVYDNSTGKTGWIKKDDPYKFMTWINFYNAYGKKYGLRMFKTAPENYKNIKSAPDDTAQNVSVINMPQQIKLVVIRGNWALVSVLDLDKTPKTGYIRWRSDDGIRYFFPAIK
ncbi:hypothetical protein IJ579_01375 [bacterium]|nr:hypothetical protein [bacterium]